MVFYTEIDRDLDRMRDEICKPIETEIKKVVEQFFPIDQEIYNQYFDEVISDFWGEIINTQKSSFASIQEPESDLEKKIKDPVEFIKQTSRRYGYLPLSLVTELRQYYRGLADTMRKTIKYCGENMISQIAKCNIIKYECGKLLKIIEQADEGLEEVIRLCKERKKISDTDMIQDYEKIVKAQKSIEKILYHDDLDVEEEVSVEEVSVEEVSVEEISMEEMTSLQENLAELKGMWQYQIRQYLGNSFFVHRCKCYPNKIEYKIITEEEFMKLVMERTALKRDDYKDYIKKCIHVFAAVKCHRSSNSMEYPKELEEILIDFIQNVEWRKKLTEFARIHNETKRMAKSLESQFYRTEISKLENKVFEGDKKYSYELCCAWNELGGFGISAAIAGTLFYHKIITKNYLTKDKENMEKFYYELERCCKVLIDFAKTESWLMGIELTHIVFGLYCRQWENKKPSLVELYISMAYMAETIESIPLKEILDHYSCEEQMIGWDGFPRRDFATMWEDDKEKYEKYFYRKDLERYEGRSNVNLFYVRVFQIVFHCVNGN